jgi:hypothetical protein
VTERESVLARVRKLLAMAKGGTKHEAEIALGRAQELMARHKITEAEAADPESPDAPFMCSSEALCQGMNLRKWKALLAVTVADACGCTVIRHSRKNGWSAVSPVGTEQDIELCRSLYAWAELKITRLALRACVGQEGVYRTSWLHGCVLGFERALATTRAKVVEEARSAGQTFGLMTVARRQAELEAFRDEQLTTKKPREIGAPILDREAFKAGVRAGLGMKAPGQSIAPREAAGALSAGGVL